MSVHLSLFEILTGVDLTSLMLVVGLYGCRLLVHDMPAQQAALRPVRIGFLVLLGVTGLLLLVGRSVEMSGVSVRHVAALLLPVVRQTRFGHWWLARTAAVCALLLLEMREHRRGAPLAPFGAWILLTILVLARSATNHAGDQGVSWLLILGTLHLYAAGLWAGVLLAATLALLPQLHRATPLERARVFERLSQLSGYAVAVLLTTGVWIGYREIGSFAALIDSTYGRVLDLKLLLVVGMLAIGAHNRYARRPALWRLAHEPSASGHQQALQNMQRAIRWEALLGLGVLALVAILIHGMPPAAMHGLGGDMQ